MMKPLSEGDTAGTARRLEFASAKCQIAVTRRSGVASAMSVASTMWADSRAQEDKNIIRVPGLISLTYSMSPCLCFGLVVCAMSRISQRYPLSNSLLARSGQLQE
jgi:hypothetical protein